MYNATDLADAIAQLVAMLDDLEQGAADLKKELGAWVSSVNVLAAKKPEQVHDLTMRAYVLTVTAMTARQYMNAATLGVCGLGLDEPQADEPQAEEDGCGPKCGGYCQLSGKGQWAVYRCESTKEASK